MDSLLARLGGWENNPHLRELWRNSLLGENQLWGEQKNQGNFLKRRFYWWYIVIIVSYYRRKGLGVGVKLMYTHSLVKRGESGWWGVCPWLFTVTEVERDQPCWSQGRLYGEASSSGRWGEGRGGIWPGLLMYWGFLFPLACNAGEAGEECRTRISFCIHFLGL